MRICSDWGSVIKGSFLPSIPRYLGETGSNQGPVWTLALIGGVGGTLTILCYGYWIRERNRTGKKDLKVSRIDLAVAYSLTALFGMAMVIIASQSNLDQQSSARMVVVLADQLQNSIGSTGRLIFLCGAWAAVFSSLLGVWQSVPYLFADFWQLRRAANITSDQPQRAKVVDTKAPAYRIYLLAITFIPMLGLKYRFVAMQKIYAVLGSIVIPLLALILLILNGNPKWVGRELRNRPVTVAILISTILLFLYLGLPKIY